MVCCFNRNLLFSAIHDLQIYFSYARLKSANLILTRFVNEFFSADDDDDENLNNGKLSRKKNQPSTSFRFSI